MTAKEMFEELGYVYKKFDNGDIYISYQKFDGMSLKNYEILSFKNGYDNKMHWLGLDKNHLTLDLKCSFDVRLFKAIEKQIEELGWLEE